MIFNVINWGKLFPRKFTSDGWKISFAWGIWFVGLNPDGTKKYAWLRTIETRYVSGHMECRLPGSSTYGRTFMAGWITSPLNRQARNLLRRFLFVYSPYSHFSKLLSARWSKSIVWLACRRLVNRVERRSKGGVIFSRNYDPSPSDETFLTKKVYWGRYPYPRANLTKVVYIVILILLFT